MDIGILAQYTVNGIMLGMMYSLVAVGFTLFFGVLDVIKFSHGDVLMVGAFTALATFMGNGAADVLTRFVFTICSAISCTALLGILIARYLVLPLKTAPSLNILLITLMFGNVLREAVRLFFPDGSNPKPFPALLSTKSYAFGNFILRVDSMVLLLAGFLMIAAIYFIVNKSRLGLAIRAVAQDEETARSMGINFKSVVLFTFALGSVAAAIAGIMNGLYYSEVTFSMGLLLGVIGFSAAVIGGLGNLYGAILGGFIFAALQTIGAVALPFASAYKDVFAFGVVILLMAFRPTGLIAEKLSERV
ncbi:MAG: branched-chain amino acid ABC transporter permease [Syntrophobacter sp.]